MKSGHERPESVFIPPLTKEEINPHEQFRSDSFQKGRVWQIECNQDGSRSKY